MSVNIFIKHSTTLTIEKYKRKSRKHFSKPKKIKWQLKQLDGQMDAKQTNTLLIGILSDTTSLENIFKLSGKRRDKHNI